MPKKKNQKKTSIRDFTINDCANAEKPVMRVKKSSTIAEITPEVSWDQLADNNVDIIEETNEDGTKNLVYKKKRNKSINIHGDDERPGVVYPEIVWYLISKYIMPEDVGRFAGINTVTYAITKRESFWRELYNKYCKNNPRLPPRLRLENSYTYYGLRQRIIRSLYHTYDVFIKTITMQAAHDSKPHLLVKQRCLNVWYHKGPVYWCMFFKFKKTDHLHPTDPILDDFIEELGRIDANPEEQCKVLQVTCQNFYEVPPVMGMTLSSVSVVLSQGFRHHRLHLGFNTGAHNISKDILPECSVVLDTVVNMIVLDWWHPKYPHFNNKPPSYLKDDEARPVLKKDFFKTKDMDS